MNTETVLVVALVAAVFAAFYAIANRAEKHVKAQYEERRQAEAARVASGKKGKAKD